MSTFTRAFVRTYVRSQARSHTHTYAHTYVRMYTPDHTRTYTRTSICSWPVVAICPAYTPQHVYETLNFAKFWVLNCRNLENSYLFRDATRNTSTVKVSKYIYRHLYLYTIYPLESSQSSESFCVSKVVQHTHSANG